MELRERSRYGIHNDGNSIYLPDIPSNSSIYPDANTIVQIRIAEGGGTEPWDFRLIGDLSGYDETVSDVYLPYNYGDFYVNDNINSGYFAYCDGDLGLHFYVYWQVASHTVSQPNVPSGPSSGRPNTSYSYNTGGAACNQEHSVEYRFDWGDGDPYSPWSSSTNVSHSWTSTGTYFVKAQARCSVDPKIESIWSGAKTVTIAVNQQPTANAGGPYSIVIPKSIQFPGSGNDPDGSIVAWEWDFGDGQSFSEQSPTHTYISTGVYTVGLRVKDNEDLWSDWDYTTATVTRPKVAAVVVGQIVYDHGILVNNHEDEIAANLRARGVTVDLVKEEYAGVSISLNGVNQDWPEVTWANRILELVEQHLSMLGANDSFIFIYAGHGEFGLVNQNETAVDVHIDLNTYPNNMGDEMMSLSSWAVLVDDDFSQLLTQFAL